MPPLLTARTCWRAGWVVIGLGVALSIALELLFNMILSGGGDFWSPSATVFYAAVNLARAGIPAGLALLVGSVVVRHVERLTDALVASGAIEALPVPARATQRRVDGAVDLDDAEDADDLDAVEHDPGVR